MLMFSVNLSINVSVNAQKIPAEIEYNAGDKTYRFRMINAEHTEMILDSDGYYNPLFKLEGSENNALR